MSDTPSGGPDEIICPHCDVQNAATRTKCRRCRRVLIEMTPEQRSLRARIAVNTSWSRTTDRTARTSAATAASPASPSYWENQVDPDRRMDAETRAKAAENARTAHYQRMAFNSAKTRSRKKRRDRVPQEPVPTESTPEPTEDVPDVTRPGIHPAA